MAKGTKSAVSSEHLASDGGGSDRSKVDRGDNIDKGDNYPASATFSYGHKGESEFSKNKFAKHNEKK